jgi:hypothetical protein
MAYGSFADLLRRAKTQAQLRGTNLSSSDVNSMGQGYFSDALDASNTDRAYNLAEASQTLAEQQAATQKDQFAQSLAQSRAEAEAQEEAAKKALTQNYVSSGLQGAGMTAMLLKGTDTGNAIVSGVKNLFGGSEPILSGGGADMITPANEALTGAREIGQGAGQLVAPTVGETGTFTGAGAQGIDAATTLGAEEAGGASLGGVMSGIGTGVGIAGLASAGRIGLGSILSNQGAETAKWQGKLMKEEPTLEGLSNRVTTDLVFGPDHSQDVDNALMVLDPVGTILKSVGCIIVTTATHPDSEEVNITRAYRDKFLDKETLRGYYIIAEKVVPLMQKYRWFKKLVKKVLVDNLIEYGRYALEKAEIESCCYNKAIPVAM